MPYFCDPAATKVKADKALSSFNCRIKSLAKNMRK